MTAASRTALDAFVDEARQVRCADELARRGVRLRRSGAELVGPCPVCGGQDRFAVSTAKDVWLCRRSGEGGDAIALVTYLDGLKRADFLIACETLLGRKAPAEIERPDPAEAARRAAERAAARAEAEAARAAEENSFREHERRRAYEIWRDGRAIDGTIAETYLREVRRIALAPATLRFGRDVKFWWRGPDGRWVRIHRGPALLAAVRRPNGTFGAVHITWLDLSRPKGKAEIVSPDGEIMLARKVRGTKKGGAIRLLSAPPAAPAEIAATIVAGEGIETVLTVADHMARAGAPLAAAHFWSLVDLGNMAGRAVDRERHPVTTRTDKHGRVSAAWVPGATPKLDDDDAWRPPDWAATVLFLGDGDSDRFTTALAMRRAEARARAAGCAAATAWPEGAMDFDDVGRQSAEPRGARGQSAVGSRQSEEPRGAVGGNRGEGGSVDGVVEGRS